MTLKALIGPLLILSCCNNPAPTRAALPQALQTGTPEPIQEGGGSAVPEVLGSSKPEAVNTASNPVDPKSETGDSAPIPLPESPPALDFSVDPDTLSLTVVFHLGGSGLWKSEESLKEVIAEVQRILFQAKIEILPQYTQDLNATPFLDVTYTPSVPNNPGVNGISFGGADLEVFVKDKVGLSKVADERPLDVPAVRTIPNARPGDKISVSQASALQARTTAHEISHQLGLPHRQDSTNLLASGTSGWTLNEDEKAIMRTNAIRKFKAKFIPSLESKEETVLVDFP